LIENNTVSSSPSNEFHVNTYTVSDQKNVAVARAAGGAYVVVLQSSGQGGDASGVFNIYGQLYTKTGAMQGSEVPVNTITTGSQVNPAVAINADGTFAVVWEGPDGNGNGVFARRFDSNGNPLDSADFQVSQYATGGQSAPGVAMDSDGDVVFTWHS